ncbi:MAG: 16S rRNA (cytidine(1402)-2'-O)-methyltransferase [Deltaproteobacteria bacterium]|nr:16S rRNA (cytidine(1402)-2'-O)-methyltransferase [Deltaproteobacteria bacterium]
MSTTGTLFVIAVPLGNPRDISARAIETLRMADDVYSEDTRSAARLLREVGIERSSRSCFDGNEGQRAEEIAQALLGGRNVALVSEAGTPAVSDPGFRVVRAAIAVGARVVPVPGASAPLCALVASGLPTDRFFFAGFPPRKGGGRREFFQMLSRIPATLILFESPVRVAETMADLAEVLGDRQACLAREISKTHEEFVRGTLKELAGRYEDERPLGEITLVVAGVDPAANVVDDEELGRRAQMMLNAGNSARDVTRMLVEETGLPRKRVYGVVLGVRGDG